MTRLLTSVLARAVPGTRVESAWVTYIPRQDMRFYFIFVDPAHDGYWARFKMRYPHWERVALKYKVKSVETHCPEFGSYEELIGWLSDVLALSRGKSNLLQLNRKPVL